MEKKLLERFFYQMKLIRVFEERCAELYAYGKIGGFLHLYIGEEAVAVGTCAAMRDDDHLLTHYRDHGWAIARGTHPNPLMAELLGKATGVSKGKGGSMHLCDPERNYWGGYAIVGGHLPLATGIAFAERYRESDRAVVCVFGDGATNIGEFHEALNMASIWKLPVLFLCENNHYGMGTALKRASAVTEIARKACAYDMPGEQCDGMDVFAVYEAARKALQRVRSGEGPILLEALTYRFRGHSMADPELYRDKSEVEEVREANDPIETLRERLLADKSLTAEELERLENQAVEAADASVRFAEESPPPPLEALYEDVYARPIDPERVEEGQVPCQK
ncbi:MAG: pyruvate dehydrogenase (acetyl-transferring) E1 component subunit alpha [Armatimonadota bacterium]|nr:pyruvate dehydrogenase (acetyl-transferring) E1 component subunit alpha [Armatimonadota bacterium]